jgi:hypothetical protein
MRVNGVLLLINASAMSGYAPLQMRFANASPGKQSRLFSAGVALVLPLPTQLVGISVGGSAGGAVDSGSGSARGEGAGTGVGSGACWSAEAAVVDAAVLAGG